MLKRIRDFFDANVRIADAVDDGEHAVRLATAALLIEVARQDETITPEELETASAAVRRKFRLTERETGELMELAEAELRGSTDYYQFTSLIKERFTPIQKERVIEHLWEVAFADGEIDRYEEHLVRRVAELLYVPHSAFIAAKHRAASRREE